MAGAKGCDRELPLRTEGIKGGSEVGVSPKIVSGMDGQVMREGREGPGVKYGCCASVCSKSTVADMRSTKDL